MSEIDLGAVDHAMATVPACSEGIKWYLPYETPMTLLGFNWFETDHAYERLPVAGRPQTMTQFPNGVKTTIDSKDCGALILSYCTAGGQVRFRTNSTRFLIQGTMRGCMRMDHMALTGSDGFDLYFKLEEGWRFYGVTRTDHKTDEFATTICSGLIPQTREVLINLPLYNGMTSFFIGLDEDATVEMATPFKDPRPIVLYGTSITQGGCATRPGMCSSNILSRMLEQQVINLGFSGSGRGEPEICQWLAEIENPALYILDYHGNVSPEELEATLPYMLDTIRKRHPDTPLLLTTPTPKLAAGREFANRDLTYEKRADIMRLETTRRRQMGDAAVFFFDAWSNSMGMDRLEGTVDGCHLTDLGFLRYSQAIMPHICRALGRL